MGWLFGRKSAVADTRALVPAWLSASEQVGFARGYEAQVDEVYRRNPVGQRAVRLVAGMLGGLTIDGDERAVALIQADGMRPPSPIDLNAIIGADGGLSVAWTRRSRLGWLWPSGAELPLGERAERYRVDVQGAGGTLTFQAIEPLLVIPGDALMGMTGAATVSVVQIGDFAESRPANVSIALS